MTALNLVVLLKRRFACVPRRGLCRDNGMPSNSELRRWLNDGAATINGKKLRADDPVEFPVTDLTWFAGKPQQVSVR